MGRSASGDIALYKITIEEQYANYKDPHDKRFHNLKYIEKVADGIGSLTHSQSRGAESTNDASTTVYSIADLFAFVKQYDKDFSSAPAVSEHVLNKDGTPKIFYHGTKESFTVFDKKKAKSSGLYGKGFYFTDSKSHSAAYGDAMAVYLNIRKPLSPDSDTVTKAQIRNFLSAVAENEDYSIENYGTYDVDEVLSGIISRDAFAVIQNINATAIGDFVEAVELLLISHLIRN